MVEDSVKEFAVSACIKVDFGTLDKVAAILANDSELRVTFTTDVTSDVIWQMDEIAIFFLVCRFLSISFSGDSNVEAVQIQNVQGDAPGPCGPEGQRALNQRILQSEQLSNLDLWLLAPVVPENSKARPNRGF